MDLDLLDAMVSVPWNSLERAADLACGTGRTGVWLRSRGIGTVDGVDLTPEMLDVAASKHVYANLAVGDVGATGLAGGAYDVVTAILVDEHLPDLRPLYAESWRLARSRGWLVLVGFHPHFIMVSGMPTHYTDADGEHVAIETHIHLLSEHVQTGIDAGWTLREMRERVVDDRWVQLKPGWERFRGHPVAFAFGWQKLT
jgi:SAM-dependent methyltransferase